MSARVRRRGDVEREEAERLAPYAQRSAESKGRPVAEPEHAYRTAFQRDRDRIVHSTAFRRLEYKTQVFVYHEGDHYRNRLTHTLEGSQIARTLARALRANEELAEAVALAHDLGHTPFGHAGERALARILEGEGGFDHNRQTLRIVDLLEHRYPEFRGLNLTQETRAGVLKHGAAWPHPVPLPPRGASTPLEAQLADVADEVAYTNHDVDDGLRSGLLRWEQLEAVPLWREAREVAEERAGTDAPEHLRRAQAVRGLLDRLVTDVVEATAERLEAEKIEGPEAVRARAEPLAGFSPALGAAQAELKAFLSEKLYHHPRVVRMSRKAERILGDLFAIYREDSRQLPPHVVARFEEEGEARAVADYIAGMTDRFALAEHRKLLDPHEPV